MPVTGAGFGGFGGIGGNSSSSGGGLGGTGFSGGQNPGLGGMGIGAGPTSTTGTPASTPNTTAGGNPPAPGSFGPSIPITPTEPVRTLRQPAASPPVEQATATAAPAADPLSASGYGGGTTHKRIAVGLGTG